jgi:hypothetical protein
MDVPLLESSGHYACDLFFALMSIGNIISDFTYFANIVNEPEVSYGLKAGVFILAMVDLILEFDMKKEDYGDLTYDMRHFVMPYLQDTPQAFLTVTIERLLNRFHGIALWSLIFSVFGMTVKFSFYHVYCRKREDYSHPISFFCLTAGLFGPIFFLTLYFFKVI